MTSQVKHSRSPDLSYRTLFLSESVLDPIINMCFSLWIRNGIRLYEAPESQMAMLVLVSMS